MTKLFAAGCDLVILACNTASAVALRPLQRRWLPQADPERRVLGIIVPIIESLSGHPWPVTACEVLAPEARPRRRLAVFATTRTVQSAVYPIEIAYRAPEIEVVQQACPGLAAAIEAGAPEAECADLIGQAVGSLAAACHGDIPAEALLACTHYPLVAGLFADALPAGTRLLQQPALVAESLARYLARHPRFAGGGPGLDFLTTGSAGPAARLGSRYFGAPVSFEEISPDLAA